MVQGIPSFAKNKDGRTVKDRYLLGRYQAGAKWPDYFCEKHGKGKNLKTLSSLLMPGYL